LGRVASAEVATEMEAAVKRQAAMI
jgi:hypothetical protein